MIPSFRECAYKADRKNVLIQKDMKVTTNKPDCTQVSVDVCFTPVRSGIAGTVSPGNWASKERCDMLSCKRWRKDRSCGIMVSFVGTS